MLALAFGKFRGNFSLTLKNFTALNLGENLRRKDKMNSNLWVLNKYVQGLRKRKIEKKMRKFITYFFNRKKHVLCAFSNQLSIRI
jgi:hypothetical protein